VRRCRFFQWRFGPTAPDICPLTAVGEAASGRDTAQVRHAAGDHRQHRGAPGRIRQRGDQAERKGCSGVSNAGRPPLCHAFAVWRQSAVQRGAVEFLRLTETMLFLMKQWAEGNFVDETREDIVPPRLHRGEGPVLDHGVLGNALGGSFCRGGEASWIMRNPAIYARAYRIRHASATQGVLSQPANLPGGAPATPANLAAGLEPGDITKYSGVRWQSDFNECLTQPIAITYRDWNNIDPASTGRSGGSDCTAHLLVASASANEWHRVVADADHQCG
jgi:hypothetical protein